MLYVFRQSAIKVDKNKFIAVASCTRKDFQSIVDIMMEYNPSDNGKVILCGLRINKMYCKPSKVPT